MLSLIRQNFIPLITTAILTLAILLLPAPAHAADFIQKTVWTLVVNLTGMLLGLGGGLLDISINTFVIGFGDTFLVSGVGVAVNQTWVIIRDLINLLFIFGLVFIGFKMILGSDSSNARRWLVTLLMAALLINFSLLITKVVVDFSNELSAQIATNGLGIKDTNNDGKLDNNDNGVAGTMMNVMGVTTIFSKKNTGIKADGESELPPEGGWGYIFGTGILFLVTAFVFGAGGMLLIIRFAVLNIYMMLSPLMFIGWILPNFSGASSQYWKGFLKKCFFAPIYLLFLYFGLQVLSGIKKSVDSFGSPNFSEQLGQKPTDVTTLAFFLLTCIFMIAALVAADKLGAEGGSQALKIGKSLRQRVQRGIGSATVGTTASLARNTVGRAANNYANSEAGKNRAARGLVGKALFKTAQYGASASYDARQVAGVGKTMGIGEGKQGGYAKNLEDKTKAHKKFLKDIGEVDIDSEEGKKKAAEREQEIREAAEREQEIAEGAQREFEENLNVGSEKFVASITELAEQIQKQKDALSEDEKKGLVTEKDKNTREVAIAAEELRLTQKQAALPGIKEAEEKRNAWLTARNTMRSYHGGNPEEETRLRNEFEKSEAAYAKQTADQKMMYISSAKAASDTVANASIAAKAQTKYARQIDYMKQMEKAQRGWAKFGPVSATSGTTAFMGAGALTGAGLATLGATGLYGVAAGVGASAKSAEYGHVLEELQKEYGANGEKKFTKEQKNKALRDRETALKTEGESSEDKKDDKK